MYTISKRFEFSASHQLDQLPDGHQCKRLHGHNYIIEVVLKANTLNQDGFVKDYGLLADIKTYIDTVLDHRHLNDVLPIVTTAENMARFLFQQFELQYTELAAIRVSETPKTWAEYKPNA